MSLIQNINKVPYQLYVIKNGIESAEVKVPLKNTQMFEELVAKAESKDIKSIIAIAAQCGGGKKLKARNG
jgi:lipopolysaccharide biosynthesis glycosyltransferase